MKIIHPVVLAMTALGALTFASTGQAFELRAVGTLNMSCPTMSPEFAVEPGMMTRFGFGALITTDPMFGGLAGIQTGALYTPIGFGSPVGSWTNFLQIPVLAKFSLPLISAALGPYAGIPVSVGFSDGSAGDPDKSVDWGLMATFGFKYPLTSDLRPVSAILDFGYQFGFGDLREDSSTSHNRNFSIMAGVAFDF